MRRSMLIAILFLITASFFIPVNSVYAAPTIAISLNTNGCNENETTVDVDITDGPVSGYRVNIVVIANNNTIMNDNRGTYSGSTNMSVPLRYSNNFGPAINLWPLAENTVATIQVNLYVPVSNSLLASQSIVFNCTTGLTGANAYPHATAKILGLTSFGCDENDTVFNYQITSNVQWKLNYVVVAKSNTIMNESGVLLSGDFSNAQSLHFQNNFGPAVNNWPLAPNTIVTVKLNLYSYPGALGPLYSSAYLIFNCTTGNVLDSGYTAYGETGGGGDNSTPLFTDGRLNADDAGQTAAIYCKEGGILEIYAVYHGVGHLAFKLTKADLSKVPINPAQNTLIVEKLGVRLYRLTDGHLQVNRAFEQGTDYVFTFSDCQ